MKRLRQVWTFCFLTDVQMQFNGKEVDLSLSHVRKIGYPYLENINCDLKAVSWSKWKIIKAHKIKSFRQRVLGNETKTKFLNLTQ